MSRGHRCGSDGECHRACVVWKRRGRGVVLYCVGRFTSYRYSASVFVCYRHYQGRREILKQEERSEGAMFGLWYGTFWWCSWVSWNAFRAGVKRECS